MRNKSLNIVFSEFLQDPIVKLYLSEPSDLVMKFARQICNNVIGSDYLPLRSLLETVYRAETKGVYFEWPLKWPINEGKIEIKRVTGKIGLF